MQVTKSNVQKVAMIQAMEKCLGIITAACQQVGIARKTHYEWMREDEWYNEQIKDIENAALDFAESQLLIQIKNGEVAATIFYLKTKGKKRGYVERENYTPPPDDDYLDYSQLPNEVLDALVDAYQIPKG